MKRFLFVLLGAALFAETVGAAEPALVIPSITLLDGTSCAAAAASRTFTLQVKNMARADVTASWKDANTDCTAMTLTCSGSNDGALTYGFLTTRSCTSGACTAYPQVDTVSRVGATAALNRAMLFYDVWGLTQLKCVVACTGTCAGADQLYVKASLAANK